MSEIIVGIDPGPRYSAVTIWSPSSGVIWYTGRHPERPAERNAWHNLDLLENWLPQKVSQGDIVAIEDLNYQGGKAGSDVFQTSRWVGRFQQWCWGRGITCGLIPRRDIKLALVGTNTANDSAIRRALMLRVGEPGTKREPGPTFGLAEHTWQALAVAVVCGDYREHGRLKIFQKIFQTDFEGFLEKEVQ